MDHGNPGVAGSSLPPVQPSWCFQDALCALTLRTNPSPAMVPSVPWSGSFPAAWSKGGAKAEFSTSSSSTQGQTSSPSGKHVPGARSPPSTHSCSQIRQPSLKPNLEPKLQVSCASHQQRRPLPSPSTLLCLPETTDRVNCAEEASKSMPCPQLFSRTAESDLQRPRAA